MISIAQHCITATITHQTRWRYATAQLACICCMHPGTPSGPESSRLFSLTSNSHYIYSIVYVCSLTDCKLLYPSGLVAHTNCMFNLLRITIIPIMVMYSSLPNTRRGTLIDFLVIFQPLGSYSIPYVY